MSDTKRISVVELWRFIAALLIMTHHLFSLGIDAVYPFRYAFVYVEFFFILTGYFTYRHFLKTKENLYYPIGTKDDIFKYASEYTLKRYISFLPYIIIMVVAVYVIKYYDLIRNDFLAFLMQIPNAITEIMLLSSITEIREAGNLWFLSALIIILPIFLILCKWTYQYLLYMIAFYIPVFFYGIFGIESITHFPYNLFRTLACMLLGIIVDVLSCWIESNTLLNNKRKFLTIIEQGSLLLALIASFLNLKISYLYLISFVVGISIMVSGKSYTYNIKSKAFIWLGKISFSVFVCHGIIQKLINFHLSWLPVGHKIIFFYSASLILSIVIFYFVEWLKKQI